MRKDVYVCMYVCMYVQMLMRIVYSRIRIFICYIDMYIYICASMCICEYAYMYM